MKAIFTLLFLGFWIFITIYSFNQFDKNLTKTKQIYNKTRGIK